MVSEFLRLSSKKGRICQNDLNQSEMIDYEQTLFKSGTALFPKCKKRGNILRL